MPVLVNWWKFIGVSLDLLRLDMYVANRAVKPLPVCNLVLNGLSVCKERIYLQRYKEPVAALQQAVNKVLVLVFFEKLFKKVFLMFMSSWKS